MNDSTTSAWPTQPAATNVILFPARPQTLAEVCARHDLIPPTDHYPSLETRLDDPEKIGQGDGYLYLFADGLGGFIQNHRHDDKGSVFFYDGVDRKMDDDQRKELKKRRDHEKARDQFLQREAAALAVSMWFAAPEAPADHPYLVRKGVTSLAPMLRVLWDYGCVPSGAPEFLRFMQYPVLMAGICDVGGRPMTIEYIDTAGKKMYHTGGEREAGLAWILRGDIHAGPVYLVEGLSTGGSVADATGRPVAVAFDGGNLPKVAKALVGRYPLIDLVVCGDDDIKLDRAKKPNKGKIKAEEAAKHGGPARLVFPDFSKLIDRGDWSDFNDMAAQCGLEAVRDRLTGATKPVLEAPWLDDPMGEIRAQGFGEAELAAMFARLRAPLMRYLVDRKKWLLYGDGVWRLQDLAQANSDIDMMCREVIARGMEHNTKGCPLRKATTRAGIETIARSRPELTVSQKMFDVDPWLLNTPGGVVDLKTGVLGAHCPEQFFMFQARVTPARVAECPIWRRFLAEVCCDDLDLAAYLQRFAGYCLTGATHEQSLSFFHGTGRNGKGTFLDTIKFIMGDYYKATTSDTFIMSRDNPHKTFLADLKDARMVTAQEPEIGKPWKENLLKELTGQDTITANHMRCDPFTFVPNFKLIIVANTKPRFLNVDPAIRSRLHFVPWFANFERSGTKDPLMREKLQAEAAGILTWMIEGCRLWRQHGLQPPQAVLNATKEYLDAEDLTLQWLEQCCVQKAGESTALKTLHQSWQRFMSENGGWPGREQDLLPKLRDAGFASSKANKNKVTMVMGIELVVGAGGNFSGPAGAAGPLQFARL